jgi:hypothetical protein
MSLLVYGSAIPTATTVDARNGGIQGKRMEKLLALMVIPSTKLEPDDK